MAELAYNAKELADALGCSEQHVRNMTARGEGPPRLPFGGRLLFPKAAVTRWLDEQAHNATTGPVASPAPGDAVRGDLSGRPAA